MINFRELPRKRVDREAFGEVGGDCSLDIGLELRLVWHGEDMRRNELRFWDSNGEVDNKVEGSGRIKGRVQKFLGKGGSSCQRSGGWKLPFGSSGLGLGGHCAGDGVGSVWLKKVRVRSGSVKKIGTSVVETRVG